MKMMNIQTMFREEVMSIEKDSVQNGIETFRRMDPWRCILWKAEGEEEEILQTRTVGLDEIIRDLPLWDEAIRSELTSLFEKKGALRRVEKAERDWIKKDHPEIIPIPAKLVVTRKAAGKRKVRIVACGNCAEKKEGEDVFASGGGKRLGSCHDRCAHAFLERAVDRCHGGGHRPDCADLATKSRR